MNEHALPDTAQIAAIVAELQLIGAPEALASGMVPVQRVDVVVWCPMVAPALLQALTRALGDGKLVTDHVVYRKLAVCNGTVLLWVNARSAPLCVRVRAPFECFSLDKPAERVFICTSSGVRKPRPTLAGPHTCNSDALSALNVDRDFCASVIRVLHWDTRPLAAELEKHAMVVNAQPRAAM